LQHIQTFEGIFLIKSAKKKEAKILTKISYKSKGYWNYPQEYFDIWNNELTISPDYIEKNVVFVFELGGALVGYYSLVELPEALRFLVSQSEKVFGWSICSLSLKTLEMESEQKCSIT
jgi:hypothetical protein